MKTNGLIHHYHYLDEGAVNRLYAQCSNFITETIQVIGGEVGGEAEGKVEIGKIAAFLGLPSGEFRGQGAGKISLSQENKQVTRIESKLSKVEQWLSETGILFCGPDSQSTPPSKTYAVIQARFNVKAGGVLEGGEHTEFEAELPFGRLLMRASGSRYVTNPVHLQSMWPHSPEGYRLANLRAFGLLVQQADYWYLKPLSLAVSV